MDAFEYLQSIGDSSIDLLYRDPWTCQAVFQSLPPVGKQFVVRLLCIDTPIATSVLWAWLTPKTNAANIQKTLLNNTITKLASMRVMLRVDSGTVQMNPIFQQNIKLSLGSISGSPWEAGREKLKPQAKHQITPLELERHARSRWDSVLHFMVGSTAVNEPPSSVIDILIRTKLMQYTVDQTALHITNSGYEFMLKDVHVQMWIFMMEYIKTLDDSGQIHKEDILIFLFQLSYCQTNEYYDTKDLTETQVMLLSDFADFGLLFRRKDTSRRFYTTSLAVNLIFGGSVGKKPAAVRVSNTFASVQVDPKSRGKNSAVVETDTGSELSLVVETNFKIYAYTTSSLHVAMMSVFVDIVTRLPNLAVGYITRESLRSAYLNGISAQQIYDFLMKHIHPRMQNNNPPIPENIADQLFLWERERNRIAFTPGTFFDRFDTREEYDKLKQYAREIGVLFWHDDNKIRLAVLAEGVVRVKAFIAKYIR